MQLVLCLTGPTFPAISFPHFKRDDRRDYSAPFSVLVNRLSKVLVFFYCYERNLIDVSVVVSLLPGVNEMKDPVIGANSRANLFIDPNSLRSSFPGLELLGGFMKNRLRGNKRSGGL